MNPLLDLWRKLDRYLTRNHAELRLLQMHRLHAGALMATAMLALIVFLLPWENLLAAAPGLRFIVTLSLGLFLFVLPLILSQHGLPFVRRSRWPHAWSVWYCLIVASAPVLILPWMIQTRVRQHVLHGVDAERWSSTLQSYASELPSWKNHCESAMTPPGMYPAEPVESICSMLSPTWLDPLLLEHSRADWLSVLLLLLLLAQRALLILSSEESVLEIVTIFLTFVVTPLLGLLFLAFPVAVSTSWILSGTSAVLVLYSLAQVLRAHRITPTFTLYWSMILAGVPLLAILGSSLLKPLALHFQVLYLGLFLLVTARLQSLYERLRALPS